MKLFQKLIVAPATLGLLVPSVAFAEEIKLADISNYSSSKEVKSISDFDPVEEIAVTNSRVDGLESRFNDFEAGSFSETSSVSFKAQGRYFCSEKHIKAVNKANPKPSPLRYSSIDFGYGTCTKDGWVR